MNLIDAHHHLWAPQTPALDIGYGWLKDIGAPKPFGDPTPIQRDYLLPEYLAEPAPHSVSASVHVQADPKIPDPVAETAFVQKISDEAGHPIAIVGFVDLTRADAGDMLARHQAHPNLRGIRQILSHLPDRPDLSFAAETLLESAVWRDNFGRLAEAGLSFDLQLYPQQMAQAAAFLADHPDIPVVIDHLGSPHDASEKGLALWREGMALLAELPQVQVKLSGYAMFFGADLEGAAQYVTDEILTLFSAERVMFGSNFPVDKLHLTYPQLLSFVRGRIGTDQAGIMGANAARFYRMETLR